MAVCLPLVTSSTKCVSCRILLSSGRPALLDTSEDLFRKFVVFERSARVGSEREDGFLVSGTLFEPDALADRRLEDLVAEDAFDLLLDVLAQERAPIVQGDDDAEQLQVGVGA